MPDLQVKSFTARFAGLSNILNSPVKISRIFNPATPKFDFSNPATDDFQAIWDTGATNSVVTTEVVRRLNLQSIGFTTVFGVHGTQNVRTYFICMYLPNDCHFDGIRVTEGNIPNVDVLIGMDIISKGDFVVTNKDGKTVFSFRTPSVEIIDFAQQP